MAVTWDVSCLDSLKTSNSLSDVVQTVHWTAYEKETVDGVEHEGYSYGTVALSAPDSSSFVKFSEITKDNAIAWAKSALGTEKVAEIEKAIADKIAISKNPTNSLSLPWQKLLTDLHKGVLMRRFRRKL